MPDIGNEFWGPSCTLTWRPRKEIYERITCSCKYYGGFFNMYDEEQPCNICSGRGYTEKRIEASLTKPEWPEDYIKYMRRCHEVYIKRTRKFRG